jgi:hypothetical protein
VDRILLISGDIVTREESLRRRVLRFTGSPSATSVIVKRIDAAQRMGPLMTCMVLPRSAEGDLEDGDESGWEVRVSYAAAAAGSEAGSHA